MVKLFGGKFTHVSPVWLQLRYSAGSTAITGDHDVDQGWLAEVKKAGKSANVKSKLLLGFSNLILMDCQNHILYASLLSGAPPGTKRMFAYSCSTSSI